MQSAINIASTLFLSAKQANGFLALSLIVVVGSAFLLYPGLNHRPIETDEYLTVQNYTWLGLHADGTRRELDELSDFQERGPITVRRVLMGFYCALGRWPEPNNHVVHSALVNIALLVPTDTLTAIRLPALITGLLFAIACSVFCIEAGIVQSAPLVATLAIWNPYSLAFLQLSRGYAVMLLLCILLVILLVRLVQSPKSKLLGMGVAVISCATFMNLVNMSIDWVIPVLVTGAFFPGFLIGFRPIDADRESWRSAIFWILMVVGSVGFVFLMDRLPYVYSSARQYGVALTGVGGLIDYASQTLNGMAPTGLWKVVGFVGLAGAINLILDPQRRMLSAPWLVALLVSMLHFIISAKLPYERNLGFFIPPILFGFGYTVLLMMRRFPSRIGGIATLGGAVILVGVAIGSDRRNSVRNDDYRELAEYLGHDQSQAHRPRLTLTAHGVSESILIYAGKFSNPEELAASPEFELVVIEKAAFGLQEHGTHSGQLFDAVSRWDHRVAREVGPYRVNHLRCRAVDLEQWNGESSAIGIWFPSFESVSLTPEKIFESLHERKIRFVHLERRYQAKMEVFGRLWAVIADLSEPDRDPEKNLASLRVLQQLRDEHGGEILLVVPTEKRLSTL